MVFPQVRPRCTHREEAAAAGSVPREVSETDPAPDGAAPRTATHGPRSVVPSGPERAGEGRMPATWRVLGAPDAPR